MTNELLAQMSAKKMRKLNGARSTGTVSKKQYAYAMTPVIIYNLIPFSAQRLLWIERYPLQ